jgi:hypothetical protein
MWHTPSEFFMLSVNVNDHGAAFIFFEHSLSRKILHATYRESE